MHGGRGKMWEGNLVWKAMIKSPSSCLLTKAWNRRDGSCRIVTGRSVVQNAISWRVNIAMNFNSKLSVLEQSTELVQPIEVFLTFTLSMVSSLLNVFFLNVQEGSQSVFHSNSHHVMALSFKNLTGYWLKCQFWISKKQTNLKQILDGNLIYKRWGSLVSNQKLVCIVSHFSIHLTLAEAVTELYCCYG